MPVISITINNMGAKLSPVNKVKPTKGPIIIPIKSNVDITNTIFKNVFILISITFKESDSLLTGAVQVSYRTHFVPCDILNLFESQRKPSSWLPPIIPKKGKSPHEEGTFLFCGGGEIRTHGTVASPPVFKTGAIDHSATPPPAILTKNAPKYKFLALL